MMLLLLLLAVSGTSLEIEVDLECPTCVLVNNTCYNVTHLFDLQAPFRNQVVIHKMGILRTQNILFYAFEPIIEDDEYYKVGFVNLDNPEINGVISGGPRFVNNFGTFDIDQDNNIVYLGGDDGIYVLDTSANKLKGFSSHGDTITDVFYKNNVYFLRYDGRGVVVKRGDNFKTLLEYVPVRKFVINKYDIIVFINSYGLYVGKGETTYRISKNAFFRGLTVDLDGVVYTWWLDGIYKVIVERNLAQSKLEKVLYLPSIGAMAFDNNNDILFNMDRGLYKVAETKYNCSLTRL